MTKREIDVFKTVEDTCRKAAQLFIAEAESSIAERGKFSVALSGGSTPLPFYSLLSTDEFRTRIDWNLIHFFWADERCVPKEHPDSNFRMVFDYLLSKVPVPDGNIHRIPGELDPEEAAYLYDRDLRIFFAGLDFPSFDLICLGVGADGHTASIFPGVKLTSDITKAAVPVYVEKLGSHRISLTLPVINNAGMVIFLVTGKSKADIVRDVLGGENPELPAAKISPTRGRLIWLLDHEAADLLACE